MHPKLEISDIIKQKKLQITWHLQHDLSQTPESFQFYHLTVVT